MAPSTTGETEMTLGSSNDALATIKGLKQRVEWLEESIGRLLVSFLSAPLVFLSTEGKNNTFNGNQRPRKKLN